MSTIPLMLMTYSISGNCLTTGIGKYVRNRLMLKQRWKRRKKQKRLQKSTRILLKKRRLKAAIHRKTLFSLLQRLLRVLTRQVRLQLMIQQQVRSQKITGCHRMMLMHKVHKHLRLLKNPVVEQPSTRTIR